METEVGFADFSSQMQMEELALDRRLRPQNFGDFPGQERVKEKLKVFVEAARRRGEALDHVLLSGPPGLGKTTLAQILSHELGVDFRSTSAPAIQRKGDLAALLTSLKPKSVLFIDEIHRLSRDLEEYIYSAMEDFYIDIVTGEGLGARSIRFQLVPFTLVGATTRSGLLNAPFRDRFGITERLDFYTEEALSQILARSAKILEVQSHREGLIEIARRCRGTPRIANRLLKRVRDYAEVRSQGLIDAQLAQYALNEMEVDQLGLDQMDRKLLRLMDRNFAGGPVGIETLAATLNEEVQTIEEVYEPYLLQEGFLQKTPRGRVLTERARAHIQAEPSQGD